ncbi:hypothetical protein [Paenibacillus wenxiniae]|uniref:Uncharacterized protein n=1 Tax=Paenibacillus wenxiniae TaxID=1636843 RepID=A0ABW4RKJ5_9BACL
MPRYRRANVEINEQSYLPAIRMAMKLLAKQEVHIGMQGDAELAMIAGVHEYGSAKMGIPARSFIGSGLKKSKAKITKLVRADITDIMHGRGKSIPAFLDEIGELGKQITVANFDRIKKPGLSPIYAKYKKQEGGGKKLLQREADLRESLTYVKVWK